MLQLHISLVILIILTLDDLLMLLGENCCWSLLGPKGLRWSTLYSQGCASKGPYGLNLAPIFCSHLNAGQWSMSGQDDHLSRKTFGLQVILRGHI